MSTNAIRINAGALKQALDELVLASRILANEGVVDAFGHVSVRDSQDSSRFLISRSRSPELVTVEDIMTLGPDGERTDESDTRKPFLERYIHAAIYEARPDVTSVVHNHAHELVAFGVTSTPLRPVMHMTGVIGPTVPVWDIADRFGDTNLLVSNLEQGRDLATCLGDGCVALMRGHGSVVAQASIKEAVLTAIYLQVNAKILLQATGLGDIKYLSSGETAKAVDALLAPIAVERAWEYFCRRATA